MWYWYLIYFLVFFIIIYLIYYILFVRKNLTYDKKKLPADIEIMESYYKIDVKKIGYQKVLRIMNFVNALMMALLVLAVIKIDKTIFKILIIVVLIVPSIWVVYYFLAKYLKYIERKMK